MVLDVAEEGFFPNHYVTIFTTNKVEFETLKMLYEFHENTIGRNSAN